MRRMQRGTVGRRAATDAHEAVFAYDGLVVSPLTKYGYSGAT